MMRAQSMVAASMVILMCLLNETAISVPPGFSWLVPAFFVKLILGYMARRWRPLRLTRAR